MGQPQLPGGGLTAWQEHPHLPAHTKAARLSNLAHPLHLEESPAPEDPLF